MTSGPIPQTTYNEPGNGSSTGVTYVSGSFVSGVVFGAEMPQTFTICSLSRWTSGPPYGRVITTTTGAVPKARGALSLTRDTEGSPCLTVVG